MCEVLAAGETLGTGSSTHGALWGVCAVVGEPMQFSLQVRWPRSSTLACITAQQWYELFAPSAASPCRSPRMRAISSTPACSSAHAIFAACAPSLHWYTCLL